MPQMGYDMQEGTLVRWLKQVGDQVQIGEPIAEIETDKAVIEFESTTSGQITQIIVDEGTLVPVGQPIIVIDSGQQTNQETSIPDLPKDTTPDSNQTNQETSIPDLPKDTTPDSNQTNSKKVSPAARRLADENNIDLNSISGTGPGGRITRDDVMLIISSDSNEKSSEKIQSNVPSKSDKVRQQIARVTTKSKQEIPHFYLTNDINMTIAMELRTKINQKLEPKNTKISVNDLIIAATVQTLKKFPKFNSTYIDNTPIIHEQINIGIAIATDDGLIVPAILECEKKSLLEIANSSKDIIMRSNSGSLNPKEYTYGTFSISNLGMYNISSFGAIILPPQTCMLATGTVAKKPIVSSNEIIVADIMTATLSGDHRVANGAEGAKFLETLKEILENPNFINI